jgi:predicted transcriptional regulator
VNKDWPQVQFRIDPELLTRLDRQAELRVFSRNVLIVRSLEHFLHFLETDARFNPPPSTQLD